MPTQALLLQLARHLGCYMQLGGQAAAEYRDTWVRRAVLLLVTIATGGVAITALWAAGLVALWETPWRLTYVVVTAVLLLVAAAVTLYRLMVVPAEGAASGLFESELRKDVELFQEWKSTL